METVTIQPVTGCDMRDTPIGWCHATSQQKPSH